MKKIFFIFLALFSFCTLAQTQRERINQAYNKNDQNYELSCFYFGASHFKLIKPVGKTNRTFGELKRNFEIFSNNKNVYFELKVSSSKKKEGKYSFRFDNGLNINGEISRKSALIYHNGKKIFYIPTKRIEKRYKKFILQNEIYKISCEVNFAMEKKIEITDLDNELHINVHPHDKYDKAKLTVNKAEKYYANSSYKSYVLLEEGNFKGNLVDLSDFLEMKEYKLVRNYFPVSVTIPTSVELKVSPAGHNRYEFKAHNNVEITYTGGNHNYCMWNNTRRVLMSYMRSMTEAKLTINYDVAAIVVQARGLVGLNFNSVSLDKNNLLKDVFNADTSQAREYTKKYYDYFVDVFFGPYKGLFKQVIIENQSVYGTYTKRINGSGKRHLHIILNYINN